MNVSGYNLVSCVASPGQDWSCPPHQCCPLAASQDVSSCDGPSFVQGTTETVPHEPPVLYFCLAFSEVWQSLDSFPHPQRKEVPCLCVKGLWTIWIWGMITLHGTYWHPITGGHWNGIKQKLSGYVVSQCELYSTKYKPNKIKKIYTSATIKWSSFFDLRV